MAMDPNRWTLKTQEAFNAAISRAQTDNHPEVTPDHLLVALLGQAEGHMITLDIADFSALHACCEAVITKRKRFDAGNSRNTSPRAKATCTGLRI